MMSKVVIEKSAGLLTVSNDLKKQIEDSGIKAPYQFTTYNPVSTDLFLPASRKRESKNFVFAGRLEDYKGGLRVLKAFESILWKYPDWSLTIIGDGPERVEIENYIIKEGLEDHVVLTGKLRKRDMVKVFQNSTIFVYPSSHETFGLVIAEAMACGLPVIAGNLTAPPEFVDKEQGLLVDPNDVEAIASAMKKLISNRSVYNAKVIREKVVERFSFEVFGQILMDQYNRR